MTVIRDTAPAFDLATVLPDRCHRPVADQGCCLKRQHSGPCLPYARWAQQDVGPHNPPTPRKPVER